MTPPQEVFERRLELVVVFDGRDDATVRLACPVQARFHDVVRDDEMRFFCATNMSGVFPVKLNETSVRISCLAVSVAMWFRVALRAMKSVYSSCGDGFWTMFEETLREMFVRRTETGESEGSC